MDDDGFWIFVCMIVFIAGLSWMVGTTAESKGHNEGREEVYLEALEKGFAQRVIDQQTGVSSWEWVGE